jgi:site-specific recombinase XerD
LQYVRLGRSGAESTTQAYAGSVALFLTWCAETNIDWRDCGGRLSWFLTWLAAVPASRPGGRPRPRGARRINAVLAAVREFVKYSVATGAAPPHLLPALYVQGDDRWLPAEVGGRPRRREAGLRARHRVRAPEQEPAAATEEQVLALLAECRSARDRFIVLVLARAGLRRGELVGMRRQDVHVLAESSSLGCDMPREHLHVHRRDDNTNQAWAKSHRSRVVPLDSLVVQAYDQYLLERSACPAAAGCDFLLVNLFGEPVGKPMRVGAVNELLAGLSRRAGLVPPVHPHMLRHGFAANLIAAGASVDEAQALLGHATPVSTQVYFHPSPDRLRGAVERVPLLETGAGK